MSSKFLTILIFTFVLPYYVIGLLTPQLRIKNRLGIINHGGLRNKFSPNLIIGKESPTELRSIQSTISLDTAILGGSKFSLQRIGFYVILITLIANRLFLASKEDDSETESVDREAIKDSGSSSIRKILQFLSKYSKAISKSVSSVIFNFVQAVKETIEKVILNREEILVPLEDWNVCKLQQRESLYGGRYIRYQFELEKPNSKIPLIIGQEIVMCSTDSKGRVLKENFFPISSSSMQGSFEILVRRTTGGGSYDKFVRSLDSLELSDEIAFKGGSYRLNYRGKDDPIKFVTVVSTGVGIAPSLQILNGILSDKDSTVEDMELLWMNGDNRDFVCDKDVAALKKKYDKKLFISKVNENKLFEQDFTQMDEILGALSPHEPNRIAVICGSIDMVTKVKDLLMVVGYPEESVLSIVT